MKIQVDREDIDSVITFIDGNVESYKIINYIKKYILKEDDEK